mmetsp:Transcript_39750/g.97693  ORF Transcript_39750/g.97693 Transcript_39750/m.97693 type:complete len:162 (-) Transcript_39750:193-678(-)
MASLYASTLIPKDSLFTKLPPKPREVMATTFWALTLLLVLGGFYDPIYWVYVVALSGVHSLVFLILVGGSPLVFPAQLRVAYLAWVVIGTFVPYMSFMMAITALGLPALIFSGYCPLARMLYLLPWNRQHGLDAEILWKVAFQPPGPGRFQVYGTRPAKKV